MSAAGCKRVPVICATCNGSGKIKTVNKRFEVELEECPICHGSGKITVARKVSA